MRSGHLTREGPPREHQEERGDGPVFWLSEEKVEGTCPLFPKERGVKRVDDRKVLRGIIHVIQKGLGWMDAPAADGSHKNLYNRCRRWPDKGGVS